MNGKWIKSIEDPKEILEQEAEDRKHGTATCRIVREETFNGQPATVYSLHSKTENATEEAEMWIAKGTGQALREEIDMDVGGGAMGKATCPSATSTAISSRRCKGGNGSSKQTNELREVFPWLIFVSMRLTPHGRPVLYNLWNRRAQSGTIRSTATSFRASTTAATSGSGDAGRSPTRRCTARGAGNRTACGPQTRHEHPRQARHRGIGRHFRRRRGGSRWCVLRCP